VLHRVAHRRALRIEDRGFRRDEHFDLHAAISGAQRSATSRIVGRDGALRRQAK
jgi:hypothetical protein